MHELCFRFGAFGAAGQAEGAERVGLLSRQHNKLDSMGRSDIAEALRDHADRLMSAAELTNRNKSTN